MKSSLGAVPITLILVVVIVVVTIGGVGLYLYVQNKLNSVVEECSEDSILRLYEEKNYEGRCIALKGSVDNLADYNFDNISSSLKIKDGYSATFFDEADYKGNFRIVWTSTPYSTSGFDNLVSSIRVKEGGTTIEIKMEE
ncbi:MAG: hypothetical protein HYS87_02235 [Candidatus Colwellbacteria bacterium]|nr:hypothetical protein [Candidatus Colwellbacteria bacterium]